MAKLGLLSLLILLLGLLPGCATKITSIKADLPINIKSNEGYLMLAIDTNVNLINLRLGGKKSPEFQREDLRVGSNYLLTSLPAGQYYLRSIGSRGIYHRNNHKLDGDELKFTIKPNQINYVGTVHLRKAVWSPSSRFILINQSSLAFEYLQQHFPKLLASQGISYQGPGEDNFFDVINLQPTQQESAQ
ncbi:MAG: hypothetical protein MJK04_04165 [Psychrosphaera sp.]|nr:hypothetical protein [Psychrosphaera sp.]